MKEILGIAESCSIGGSLDLLIKGVAFGRGAHSRRNQGSLTLMTAAKDTLLDWNMQGATVVAGHVQDLDGTEDSCFPHFLLPFRGLMLHSVHHASIWPSCGHRPGKRLADLV